MSQFEGDALFCYLPIIQGALDTWIASGDGNFMGEIYREVPNLLTSGSFAGSFPEALELGCL